MVRICQWQERIISNCHFKYLLMDHDMEFKTWNPTHRVQKMQLSTRSSKFSTQIPTASTQNPTATKLQDT